MATNIVIFGASGDLARRKVIPALFALHCQGLLPSPWRVVGYGRSPLSTASFREDLAGSLTCRYTPHHECGARMTEFLERCFYFSGDYGRSEDLLGLRRFLAELDKGEKPRLLFYLAVPPSVFTPLIEGLGKAGLAHEAGPEHWPRVVMEKPFGSDRESADALQGHLQRVFQEEQIYRIDHYLGKEVIQNLLVLRFANSLFEPIWNRLYVEKVDICYSDDQDLARRGQYFDAYGIIRDVMQNHLVQIMALVAMEGPIDWRHYVRNEKMKVLRCVEAARPEDVQIGQYSRGKDRDGREHRAYVEEDGVAPDSLTPTWASVRLNIRNSRWDGVPFVLTAGKGQARSRTQIRMKMRPVPANIFSPMFAGGLAANELVIDVQPEEAIYLRIINKAPGLDFKLVKSELNLRYAEAFAGEIPEAYERLLLDVLGGDRGMFMSHDELAAAWDIFTPVLKGLIAEGRRPLLYPFGSAAVPC